MQQAKDTPIKLQLQGAAKVLSQLVNAPGCETDDKELPEDLDKVTMIAEPEDEVHYESG